MSWSGAIASGPRRVGKTTQTIAAVKALGDKAVMVCYSEDQAKEIRQEHKINTVSCQVQPEKLLGSRKAYLFDPDAVAMIVGAFEQRLTIQRLENQELRAGLEQVRNILDRILERK